MIEVEPGLNLRFPQRSAEFIEGVEIGILAGQLATGVIDFARPVGRAALEQAGALAAGLGYSMVETQDLGNQVLVRFSRRRRGAHLRLVTADRLSG
jgi:uncharacterized protein YcfJ